MIRRIIQIDEEKCNGCGACAEACHEGAIGMVNGKATLLRDDYCDGLGDCLPTCPTGAISFVEREAAAYDEKAVQENMRKKAKSNHAAVPHTGCPGSRMQRIQHSQETPEEKNLVELDAEERGDEQSAQHVFCSEKQRRVELWNF